MDTEPNFSARFQMAQSLPDRDFDGMIVHDLENANRIFGKIRLKLRLHRYVISCVFDGFREKSVQITQQPQGRAPRKIPGSGLHEPL